MFVWVEGWVWFTFAEVWFTFVEVWLTFAEVWLLLPPRLLCKQLRVRILALVILLRVVLLLLLRLLRLVPRPLLLLVSDDDEYDDRELFKPSAGAGCSARARCAGWHRSLGAVRGARCAGWRMRRRCDLERRSCFPCRRAGAAAGRVGSSSISCRRRGRSRWRARGGSLSRARGLNSDRARLPRAPRGHRRRARASRRRSLAHARRRARFRARIVWARRPCPRRRRGPRNDSCRSPWRASSRA